MSTELAQWHSLFSTSDIKEATAVYEELYKQLADATARELHSYDVAKQCREELAAAVELLSECRTKLDWHVIDGEFLERIDAALAKINEGK